MDYDDNDFQSQNFQLAGEDNNKFPSGLRTFALPSFDLDDHLQVHLRFDSLVEQDLLQIPGQEENNWINNFSPGGSAIEFSSNAAESCSISRHNNVWSEATSSESVEMLLKSVSEDDMMENDIITEQLDSDAPNDVNNNFDTSLTNVDSLNSKNMDPINANPASLPDRSHSSLPGTCKDTVYTLSPVEFGCEVSKDEKLSEKSLDLELVGSMVQYVHNHYDGKMTSSSAMSFEDHKVNAVPSTDQKCEERVQEENSLTDFHFDGNASHDHLVSDLSKTSLDSTHLNMHIDSGSAPSTSVMDVIISEQESTQKPIDHVSEKLTKDLLYETPEMLGCSEIEKNVMLQTAMETDEGNSLGSCTGALGHSSGSEKLVAPTILLMDGFNEYSKKSDGLLEVIVDQVNVANEGCAMVNQRITESKEKYSAVFDDVSNLEVTSVATNKVDTLEPSTLSQEIDSHSEMSKTHNVDFLEGPTELVHDYGGREHEFSVVVMEDKQEPSSCEFESNSDEINFDREKVHSLPDQKGDVQIAETRKQEKPGAESLVTVLDKGVDILNRAAHAEDVSNLSEKQYPRDINTADPCEINSPVTEMQELSAPDVKSVELCHTGVVGTESCVVSTISSETSVTEECTRSSIDQCPADLISTTGLVGDTSVLVQSASSATVVGGPLEKDVFKTELGLTDAIPSSTKLTSSDELEDTHQLLANDSGMVDEIVENKELVRPTLPTSELIISDRHGEEPSRISNGTLTRVLEISNNLQPANLTDSVPDVIANSGQQLSTVIVEPSCLQDSQVAVFSHNELQCSTDSHTTLDCSMDVRGHMVGAELEEKDECGKLPSEACEKEPSTTTGNLLHPTDESQSVFSSKVNDESILVETGCVNSSEESCGSPTVISCDKYSHDQREDLGTDEERTGQSESTAADPKESITCIDDKSFTFEVGQLSEPSEETVAKGWRPFSSTQSFQASHLGDDTSTKCDSNVPRETSKKFDDVATISDSTDKTRSLTASTSKRKTKERSTPKKTTRNQNPRGTVATSLFGTISKDLQLDDTRQYPSVGGSGTTVGPSCSPTIQASNLPDLNSTTSAFGGLNQPFTDSQQVQLRAQIFVYGSLIQGILPDEACMVSAFGDADGGRSKWEGVWHAVAGKNDNKKIALAETSAHSVVKASDQASRSISLQSKAISTPHSRNGNKGSDLAIFSPISLPSPVWSGSAHDKLHSSMPRGSHLEPNQLFSPLHPYQSPNFRQSASSGTAWLTQPPHSVSWVGLSHTSALETSKQPSVLPTAGVQFTPARYSSISLGSNIQLSLSAGPLTESASSASAASTMQVDASRKEIVSGTKKVASSDQKSQRRKKGPVPEAAAQMLPVLETQSEFDPSTGAPRLMFSPISSNTANSPTGGLVSSASPTISPTHFQIAGNDHSDPKIIFPNETFSKIEQAKLQAEDAAAFAAATVRRSEGIWNQLAAQRKSGLVSDVEQKLASAAVAAAAAAAVAKAASAAAKVAADCALQAKLVADEAMISRKAGKAPQSSEIVDYYGGNDLSTVTPASILKGKEKANDSYSIIPAAREAARRRLEAASAATKRAENLDAIVRAAELAAEAVSQAGSIVAMGDPLPSPLSTIIEGGKAQHSKAEQPAKADVMQGEKQPNFNQLPLNERGFQETAGGEIIRSTTELSRQSTENYSGGVSGISSPTDPPGQDGKDHLAVDLNENIIKEGSVVEVMSNVKGPGGVWYSARVLDLKDSKAYVCYNELLTDEGSDKIKEWISLDCQSDNAPRIRAAQPIAAKKSEGPRKRRRTVAGTYIWDIGDRVDAWINEGWREGVITEKSEDITKFIVHFPAGNETTVVRSWDLRQSLVWRDGQWIEWTRSVENISKHHEGDTPQRKRQKLSKSETKINPKVEVLGDKISRSLHTGDTRKPGEFAPLSLSVKEKVLSFGQTKREENNSERTKRTGLQKEGSTVIFGIPKPGKKKKFMDVSKHCVVDNTEKKKEGNESLKFAKYLMPQSSTVWKNVSKVDSRSKRTVENSKVLKSAKSQNIQTRSLAEKESSSIAVLTDSSGEGSSRGTLISTKPSATHLGHKLEKKNLLDVESLPNSMGMSEDHVLTSHLHSVSGPSGVPFSQIPATDVEAAKTEKGSMHAVGSLNENEDKISNLANPSNAIPDANEPRRSNRRIQPTSRLLEGLQSSLAIAKIPSVSHDKGSKAPHRTVSSSRGHIRR